MTAYNFDDVILAPFPFADKCQLLPNIECLHS